MIDAPADILRHARRELTREAPALLGEAIGVLNRSGVPEAQFDQVLAVTGLGLALARLMADARMRGGRELVDTIMALHARLGHATARDAHPRRELLKPIKPYEHWLDHVTASRAAMHAIVMQWIEIFDERTIMHRYGDRWHRRRHAAGLIAAPLRAIFDLPAGGSSSVAGQASEARMGGDPLILFAERLLAFWDLYHATSQAVGGWNRIELPAAASLGGFYGLADEARPPDETAIRQAAGKLAAEIRAQPITTIAPACDNMVCLAERLMAELAEGYATDCQWRLKTGANQSGAGEKPTPSWWGRIARRLRGQ